MMKRLLVISLLLNLVMICCAFGTRLVHIGNCEPPGLFGMMPGETSLQQAFNILSPMSNLQRDSYYPGGFWMKGSDGKRIYINANKDANPYSDDLTLELDTFDETPILSLGQIIDSGCEPANVYRINVTGPDTIILLLVFGQRAHIMVAVDAHTLVNSYSAITSLWFVAPQLSENVLNDIRLRRHFDDEIAWLGYASVDDYWAEAPIK